jgi:hypothetical protein
MTAALVIKFAIVAIGQLVVLFLIDDMEG